MHPLSNQELARIRYAETLRNASRRPLQSADVEVVESRAAALASRARRFVSQVVWHAPAPRATA